MATTLELCKSALRITTTAYNDELNQLIYAAQLDLDVAGVDYSDMDNIVTQAVITYVRAHFGSPEDYDRLKASYDEQKAQLQTATGYTDWGLD